MVTLNSFIFVIPIPMDTQPRNFKDQDRQNVLFCKGYNPDPGKMILKGGAYLPFDTVTSQFQTGGDGMIYGRLFYPDGSYSDVTCDTAALAGDSLSVSLFDAHGAYVVTGDTLIQNGYIKHKKRWYLEVTTYKILNDSTLELTYKDFNEFGGSGRTDCHRNDRIYRYVPLAQLPSQYGMEVKKEDWMWMEPADHKEWKQKQKRWAKMEKAKRDALKPKKKLPEYVF